MKRTLCLAALLVAGSVLPVLASGHPPNVDPQNSCLVNAGVNVPGPAPVPVNRVLSYLGPLGVSLPCVAGDAAEWGSHAPPCPAPAFVGAIPGAYCGPVVPAGGTATCTWNPVGNQLPVRLVIGFDSLAGGGFNGNVNLVVDGERPVFGPFPPGAWRVGNPYGAPARVVGYPTNVALPPDARAGLLDNAAVNNVICVTP